jgi:hypothetical protein
VSETENVKKATSENASTEALPATPAGDVSLAIRLHDKKGVPIYPGDLLKSFHFAGARRKRYWLYHVVVASPERAGTRYPLEMVPASHLEPTKRGGGGRCPLNDRLAEDAEVIDGTGPGDILDFADRPRKERAS